MKTPLLLVELATAEVPSQPLLGDESWICSSGSTYHDLRAYFVIPPDATKAPESGHDMRECLAAGRKQV